MSDNQTSPPPAFDRAAATVTAKTFRKQLDDLLQGMKEHAKSMRTALANPGLPGMDEPFADDPAEAMAQHMLSVRDLESAIMRQGMVLKSIGATNPYPNSKDPSNLVIEPTAEGLTM